MSMTKLITIYNPGDKLRSSLIEEFVVRQTAFETILQDITKSKNKFPEQHYLIVGQRGSGKTTMLYRLKYAIEDNTELKKKLIPINLGEELYQINQLVDLWEAIGEALQDSNSFGGLQDRLHHAIETAQQPESKCFEILQKALDAAGKKIVLFVDNFGELIKKIGDLDTKRFREVLMNHPQIRLIGGTAVALDTVLDYQQPFFEFFKIVELKGLTTEETQTLLLKLADLHESRELIERIISEKPERVEIFRRLSGGVIRTMVLLFKVFTENESGGPVKDLQMILDSLTPLYKHRMDDLPAQQQKIIDAVARNWDAVSVKEIARITRIPSKVVSAQLLQLEKNQIVEKVTTESKNNLYHIKERFFNIWYLMRYGKRHDKTRVIWLVRFFESWCDGKELEERIRKHIHNLGTDKFDRDSAILMGEAYAGCESVPSSIKEELLDRISAVYPGEIDKASFDLDGGVIKAAYALIKEKKFIQALSRLSEIRKITSTNYRAIASLQVRAGEIVSAVQTLKDAEQKELLSNNDLFLLGELLHYDLKDYRQAITYYEKAGSAGVEKAYVSAARVLSHDLKDYVEAERLYLQGLSAYPNKKDLYHELGHFYSDKMKDPQKAVRSFQESINSGRSASHLCLGIVYFLDLQDFDQALVHFKKSGNRANFHIGALYEKLKADYPTAVEYFTKALNTDFASKSLVRLGKLYFDKLADRDKAIGYLEKAYKDYNSPEAVHQLAHIYEKDEETRDKALELYNRAIAGGDSDANACLARFYMEHNMDKVKAIELIQAAKKADMDDSTFIYEYSANVLLWAGEIEAAIEDIKHVLKDDEYFKKELADITSFLVKLIAKGLHYPVLKIFEDPTFALQDKMKPLYYALLSCMGKKYSQQVLRMGPELKETVDGIVAEIEALKKIE